MLFPACCPCAHVRHRAPQSTRACAETDGRASVTSDGKIWMTSSQHRFKGCFPHLHPPNRGQRHGDVLGRGETCKSSFEGQLEAGEKKEGKGKRRKTLSREDAERTNAAHLTEEMNGRMSDNGTESPKLKGEKQVTATEEHSPTQQPALPRHRTLSLQDKPILYSGFAGILPKMGLSLLGSIKPRGRLRAIPARHLPPGNRAPDGTEFTEPSPAGPTFGEAQGLSTYRNDRNNTLHGHLPPSWSASGRGGPLQESFSTEPVGTRVTRCRVRPGSLPTAGESPHRGNAAVLQTGLRAQPAMGSGLHPPRRQCRAACRALRHPVLG